MMVNQAQGRLLRFHAEVCRYVRRLESITGTLMRPTLQAAEKDKQHQLTSPSKSVEEQVNDNGIRRCQRSLPEILSTTL